MIVLRKKTIVFKMILLENDSFQNYCFQKWKNNCFGMKTIIGMKMIVLENVCLKKSKYLM